VTRRGDGARCAIPADAAGPVAIRLVVTDPTGRCDTTTTAVVVGAGELDHFARPDGPPGPPWFGSTSMVAVRGGALVLTGTSGYLTWNGTTFGMPQEAWMQFDSLSATAPEHDLLLLSQGPSWSAGAVQVTWSAPLAQVVVNTYSPGAGWTRRGGPWHGVAFAAGDRFGARAYADGRVRVLRNGVAVGECSVLPWAFAGSGGRIGMILSGASGTRIARFGGGTFTDSLPPEVFATRDVATFASQAASAPPPRVPAVVALSAAMPNPVSHDARFTLALPRAARVALAVYDITGRDVWTEPARAYGAGEWTLRWPGVDARGATVPMGVYLARVTVDGTAFLRRLTIVR
jgi:hypothetical protein